MPWCDMTHSCPSHDSFMRPSDGLTGLESMNTFRPVRRLQGSSVGSRPKPLENIINEILGSKHANQFSGHSFKFV